jgi:hypothetical protein
VILDATLTLSSNQAITSTAASQSIIDLSGAGAGNAPPDIFGVQSSVWGQDIGIGDGVSPPVLDVIVGTALSGNTGTLTVALQYALDAGSPTYVPGTWRTVLQTDVIAIAQLTAGQKIAEMTMPPRPPIFGGGFPRFIRLLYTVNSGPFTAGTIAFAGVNTGRDDVPMYGSGF